MGWKVGYWLKAGSLVNIETAGMPYLFRFVLLSSAEVMFRRKLPPLTSGQP
jgi:hypothetical protein